MRLSTDNPELSNEPGECALAQPDAFGYPTISRWAQLDSAVSSKVRCSRLYVVCPPDPEKA